MPTAAMTSKGQLTVPAEVRAELRLKTGDRVSFEKGEDGLYRIRSAKGDIMRLAGILAYDGPPVSVDDMNVAVVDAAVTRFRRSAR